MKVMFRLVMLVFCLVIGLGLAAYLGIYFMLYGGIMQAINNWGINTPLVVWGIIRAVFFEIGALPGIVIAYFGSIDRKSTRLNSSHRSLSRMPSSA